MLEDEMIKILSIINNDNDYSKINIKWLKEIVIKYNPEVVDDIFDSDDTCFCSSTKRKIYKLRFISYFEARYKK